MKKYIIKLLPIIIVKILAAALSIIGLASMPMILKYLFDFNFDSGSYQFVFYIMLYILAVVAGMVCEYVTQSFSWKLNQHFNILVKDDIFYKICNLDDMNYNNRKEEEYISMLTNDVQALEDYVENIVNVVQTVLQILIYGAFLFYLDFRVAVVIILTSSLSLLLPKITGEKLSVKKKTYLDQIAVYIGNVKDLLSGNKECTYETKDSIHLKNRGVLLETENKMFVFGKYKTFANILGGMGMYLLEIVVVIVISVLLIRKMTTIGTAIAAIGYIQSFVYPLSFLLQQINIINESKGVKKKILDFIHLPIAQQDIQEKFKDQIELEIEALAFDQFALEHINLTIRKNKKYAIIGESGSGKSTLLRVLLKNIRNYSGSIKIDGKDLANLEIAGLISHVAQEEHIFDTNFLENSTVFHSYSADDIERLCKEIDNPILNRISQSNENAKTFSGGEKQILSLIRMLVKKKEILLLDEPFSALDKENALALQKYILCMKEKTIIMVTHDASQEVLSLFDYVIKMKHGKIDSIEAV